MKALRASWFFAPLVLSILSACGTGPPPANQIDWIDSARDFDLRGQNGSEFSYRCPPDGEFSTIWGTNIYTDDSSICTAAVHAGKITRTGGGVVTLRIMPGQDSYTGSSRNGVESQDYWQWDGSFTFP